MTTKKNTTVRRALAVAGAAALGLLALPMTASAAPQGEAPWETGAPTKGSLTIKKHVRDGASTAGNPEGAALEGVEFTVTQVGTGTAGACDPINLTIPADWAKWESFQTAWNGSTTQGVLPAGYCAVGTPEVKKTNASGVIELTVLDLAPYLVVETNAGPNVVVEKQQPFLVTLPMPSGTQWDYSPVAYPKNVIATPGQPTKTVEATNTAGSTSGLPWMPDAVVSWEIVASIPAIDLPYNQISITDISHSSLIFDNDSVDVNLTDTTAEPNKTQTLIPTTDYTVTGGVITLTPAGRTKVNMIVCKAAGLGHNARINAEVQTTLASPSTFGAMTNDAKVTLNDQDSDTVAAVPGTNWGQLRINKHVQGSTTVLAGAKFALWPAPSGGCQATAPSTGTTTIGPTLAAGTLDQVVWISNTAATNAAYCVQETEAPDGYVLDPVVKTVTVSTAGTGLDFPNTKPTAPTLPLTGGTGTIILTVAGVGVMALAIVVAVRRQKKTA